MSINIYKRFYIVFNQEDKECALGDREISGYLKVEFRGNRGRITAALQNLNPVYSYNVKLLKDDGEITVVDFGAIKVDDKGRGGGEWIFNLEDVKDSGLSWEEFSIAFIEARDNGKMLIPLVSVINKKSVNWKTVYRKYISKIKREETLREESDKSDKEFEQEEIKDNFLSTYEDKKDENFKNDFEGEDRASQSSLPNSQSDTSIYIPSDEGTYSQTVNSLPEQEKDLYQLQGEAEEGYIKYLKEYVNNIVNFLEEVRPFEEDMKGYRWWKVKTGYREGSLDHYLVGFANDEKGELKYIVYGMPGFFTLADQPFGGMTGFVVWKSVKENFRGTRGQGYWILHIDAKTGQIAVPIEPTPPPLV
ncbi:MAG TPA: hypothetical protein GXX15_07315 [Clostridia bacterium]|nr:hypothetical protein [Clostridia bacterium]